MKIVLTVALLAGLAIFAPNHVAVAQAPRVKAIWEPVNFKGDIEFTDVQFINEDTGWVSGGASVMAGGVILFTKDAGRNWEVQYGDPQSSDRGVSSLRILDAKHGWAVQGRSESVV